MTSTILMADIFIRISAISLFILLGALIVRGIKERVTAYLAAWSCLSAATYLVCTSALLSDFFAPLMLVVQLLCHMGQPAVWMFSMSQFQDKFRPWPWGVGIAVFYYGVSRIYFNFLYGQDTLLSDAVWVFFSTMRFGLIAHMIWVAWQGRRDDLIEARRNFRIVYIVLVSIVSIGITVWETWFETRHDTPFVALGLSMFMWVLSVVLLWHVVTLRSGILFVGGERRKRTKAEKQDPTERHDIEAVEKLIGDDALYTQAGLTIAALADTAGLPEHRLRRLINQHLGYRNFADFLNHYRIDAAKERLSSIEGRNMPVLTIAMNLGYGSLGPFNRAFKERTGQTPTEFRKTKLADS